MVIGRQLRWSQEIPVDSDCIIAERDCPYYVRIWPLTGPQGDSIEPYSKHPFKKGDYSGISNV